MKERMYGFWVGQRVETLVSLKDELGTEIPPDTVLVLTDIAPKVRHTMELLIREHPEEYDRKDYFYNAVRPGTTFPRIRANFVTIARVKCDNNCGINDVVGGDHAYCKCKCHPGLPAIPPSRERRPEVIEQFV